MPFAEMQRAAWEQKIELENYPHGATFPLEFIRRFLPRGLIIDAGCGTGKNVRLEAEGYGVMGFDINQYAIVAAESEGLPSFVSDLTRVGVPGWPYSSLVLVEWADAVLAEGLMCNLVGEQVDNFFQVANFYLTPDGYLLMADILQPIEEVSFLRERLPPEKAEELVRKWEGRYRVNEKLGLSYGTFVVAKPGPNKAREWGSTDQLQALIASPDFERYARHYTREEIRTLAASVNLKERYFEPTIFYSREGEPLLGCLFAFQKGDTFQIHPWYKGMTHQQRAQAFTLRDWLGAVKLDESIDFFREIWAPALQGNMSQAGLNWQELFPQLQEF